MLFFGTFLTLLASCQVQGAAAHGRQHHLASSISSFPPSLFQKIQYSSALSQTLTSGNSQKLSVIGVDVGNETLFPSTRVQIDPADENSVLDVLSGLGYNLDQHTNEQPVALFGTHRSSASHDGNEHSDLWQWRAGQWTVLAEGIPGFTDRSTVIHQHWLISCFAADCICFNTVDRTASPCVGARRSPTHPRVIVAVKQISPRRAVVTGSGGDVSSWLLDLSRAPLLRWRKAARGYPGAITDRSSSDKHVCPSCSGYSGGVAPSGRQLVRRDLPATDGSQGGGGLNVGAVIGIVVGICAFFMVAAGFILWKRRQQRRRLHFHHKHRAARFSLSTPPPSRPVSELHRGGDCMTMARTASLPDPNVRLSTLSFGSDFHVSMRNDPTHSSVSVPHSRFDSRIDHQSLHDLTDPVIQRPEPALPPASRRPSCPVSVLEQQSKSSPPPMAEISASRRSSTAFRRLTLNLSSALRSSTHQQRLDDDVAASSPSSILKRYTIAGLASERRRSSMLGLGSSNGNGGARASRFLHIPGASAFAEEPNPRMSLSASSIGGRSVSSVQWVGFNDDMDYKEQHWNPTVQLAVTNQQRQSVSSSRATSLVLDNSDPYMSSRGTLTSTTSPRNSILQRQQQQLPSPVSYRLSMRELYSWDDNLFSQRVRSSILARQQQPGSSSSLPAWTGHHRLHNDSNASSADSFVIAAGKASMSSPTRPTFT